jgi:S1-C subfamily serine protease
MWGLGVAVAIASLGGCAATRGRTYGEVTVHEGPNRPRGGSNAQLARSRQAIAVIETDVGRGMGFVIDPRGYVITNRHVIEDADHIESVSFPDGEPARTYESIKVVYTDPEQDLALLHIQTTDVLAYIPLATRKVVPVGRYLEEEDLVTTFRRGDEDGDWLSLDRGAVERLAVYNPAAGPGAFVGVSAPVHRGQSGGPVLDDAGRVVGVVTWTWRDKDGGFAIPIAEATRMLQHMPELDGDAAQVARATSRSRQFLGALGRGDVEGARRLTSPSFARKIRGETVSAILGAIGHDGLPVLQGFVAAVESVVDNHKLTGDAAFDRLREIVSRTGTEAFRTELGVDAGLSRGQVVSFFYEFGQAYYAARSFGKEEPGPALEAALRRLQTIDAARTFALSETIEVLAGTAVEIEHVELVPAAYQRRAIVTLRGVKPKTAPTKVAHAAGLELRKLAGDDQLISVHLRLEWGDWYVASIGPSALAG